MSITALQRDAQLVSIPQVEEEEEERQAQKKKTRRRQKTTIRAAVNTSLLARDSKQKSEEREKDELLRLKPMRVALPKADGRLARLPPLKGNAGS